MNAPGQPLITPLLLTQIAERLYLNPSISTLRQLYPAIHFTECMEGDIVSRVQPALDLEQYAIYLVSGASGHCLSLTSEFALATGIVIAAKADDE